MPLTSLLPVEEKLLEAAYFGRRLRLLVGQHNFGVAHWVGAGVAQSDAEAVRWFRKAAEQGAAPAEYKLGVAYAAGAGVAKDDTEAANWLRRAAEQGHADAQNDLGAAYRAGKGVPRDDVEAMRWFRKAAEQGHAGAQANLSRADKVVRRHVLDGGNGAQAM